MVPRQVIGVKGTILCPFLLRSRKIQLTLAIMRLEDIPPTDQDPSDFQRYGLVPPGQNNPEVAEPTSRPPDPRAYTGPTEKDARGPLPDLRESLSPTMQERTRGFHLSGYWVCCECRQTNENSLTPTRCPVDGHYKCRSCHVSDGDMRGLLPDQRDYPPPRDQDVDAFSIPNSIHHPSGLHARTVFEIPEPEFTPPDPRAYAGPTQKDARDLLSRPINPSSPTDQDPRDSRHHQDASFGPSGFSEHEKEHPEREKKRDINQHETWSLRGRPNDVAMRSSQSEEKRAMDERAKAEEEIRSLDRKLQETTNNLERQLRERSNELMEKFWPEKVEPDTREAKDRGERE
jgi:hypothetical protein